MAAPVGYIKTEEQHLEKVSRVGKRSSNPVVVLGTGAGIALARNQLGEIVWKRPTYATVYRILTNPIASNGRGWEQTGAAQNGFA